VLCRRHTYSSLPGVCSIELLAAIAILAADWGTAATHMAYTNSRVTSLDGAEIHWVGPTRLPFYDRKLPIFGDVWHLVGGLRYVPMVLLAWIAFGPGIWYWDGWHCDPIATAWYLGTALVNSIGWQVLKKLHRKNWPLHRWFK